MNANDYQQDALRTAHIYRDKIDQMDLEQCRAALKVAYAALGLAGEAGEVANTLKKMIRDGSITDPDRIEKASGELGDASWYLADTCDELGLNLGDVMYANIAKLTDRMNRGVIQGDGSNR